MKLSEKGVDKLFDSQLFGNVEFEPDDFQGAVVLTVDEAKQIIGDYINTNAEIVRRYKIPELKIKHPKSIVLLTKRIEQAEGKENA